MRLIVTGSRAERQLSTISLACSVLVQHCHIEARHCEAAGKFFDALAKIGHLRRRLQCSADHKQPIGSPCCSAQTPSQNSVQTSHMCHSSSCLRIIDPQKVTFEVLQHTHVLKSFKSLPCLLWMAFATSTAWWQKSATASKSFSTCERE